MSTRSHYARLCGLAIILWLDGKPLKGAAAQFESIKKVTKDGEFCWFAPKVAHGNWRGFKVPADLMPNGLASRLEISVGVDGPRTLLSSKVNTVAASARNTAAIQLGEDPMVAKVTVKQHDGYFTFTPAVTRPNAGSSTPIASNDDLFG